MRKQQSSITAMGIAVVRAIESARPEGTRICYDPFARRLVSGALYHFVRLFDRLGYSEWKGPGVMGFLVARDRYIDDFLLAGLDAGLEQLVILGAGLDARAYRFESLLDGIKVFEVDHPASQEVKLRKLARIFGAVPAHVTYVPVDFDEETLEQGLLNKGYDERLKTFFIWQGVTQYLTPQGVDNTLSFVAAHSGPGSTIIFDYMYAALLQQTTEGGPRRYGEVSNMRRYRWMTGENLAFGIPEGQVESLLEQRGFDAVQNVDHVALHDLYFSGANAKRSVAYGYAIATATVAPH
jgi:methyltransferase (TIGR00027 family)